MTTSTATAATIAPTISVTGTTRGPWADAVMAAFRAVVGFLFLLHGTHGFGAFGGIDGQGTGVPFGVWPFWWASVIELVGGALVLLGLFTRPAAVLCSGTMAFAYFTVHQPIGALPLQNMGEPAALYSWIFLLVAVLGAGRYSLDSLRTRRAVPRGR